ncbi:MAG: hypothetical protein LW832_11045 [Parachlamydia sp.]|jgi:hypothetical protein|nr:hypothetical protein [Parachlamydia sp.]
MNQILEYTATGALIGYGATLICPIMSPLAGALNGISFGFISSQTNIFAYNRNQLDALSTQEKAKYIALNIFTVIGSAAVSTFACLVLNSPTPFSACLIYPLQASLVCSIALCPLLIGVKMIQQITG